VGSFLLVGVLNKYFIRELRELHEFLVLLRLLADRRGWIGVAKEKFDPQISQMPQIGIIYPRIARITQMLSAL